MDKTKTGVSDHHVWIETAKLRFVVREILSGFQSRHLQQMLKCAITGEVKWQDVPEVEGED